MLLLQFREEFGLYSGFLSSPESLFADHITFGSDPLQGVAVKTFVCEITENGRRDLVSATSDAGGRAHVGIGKNARQDNGRQEEEENKEECRGNEDVSESSGRFHSLCPMIRFVDSNPPGKRPGGCSSTLQRMMMSLPRFTRSSDSTSETALSEDF